MADAVCGPSNPLQNLQKHTSADRTLQQDRLVNRQSPAQGFRSQNPNPGALDAEFEAFEHGFTNQSHPEFQQPGPFMAPSHAPQQPFSANAADWAADFQKLQLSGPAPMPQQQFQPAASQGWQSEFLRQEKMISQQQQAQQRFQHINRAFPSSQLNYQTPLGMAPTGQNALQNKPQTKPETFDESAFEAAFNQAEQEMKRQMETQERTQSQPEEETSEVKERSTDATQRRPSAAEQIRIGSDLIDNKTEDGKPRRDDPDELARTAGQLLDSVSHDQSQKFKESQFLALMRRIRDREVQLEGDEFREVSPQ